MAISASDLKLYASANMPTSDSGTAGGAIDTGTQIIGTTIGEWLKNFAANAEGGADKNQYQKAFVKNTHGSDSYTSAVAYIMNALKDVATQGTCQIRITDETDATDTTIRVIGHNASGVPQTEDIEIDAETGWVTGLKEWKADASGIIACLVLATSTGAEKVLATANVEIKRDIDLGIVPVGYSEAVGFVYIWLVGTLNDSGTSTNRVTAPGGSSFSKPNAQGDGLSFAATLGAGDAQGVWAKAIYYDGMPNLTDCDFVLKTYGESA